MTILHLITRLIVGGAQQNTIASCAAQVAAGHRVVLAYGPIYGPEGSLLEEARASGAELVEIRTLRRAVLPAHDLLCYRAIRGLIRRVQPDVVHTHSSKAGILGRAAAWREDVPAVVHTIHGLPFHPRNRWVVNAIYVAAERWAAKRCHAIIGVTQDMCDAFSVHGIGRPGQFTVVPSGVDTTAFAPLTDEQRRAVRAELGVAPDAPLVGLVARLDPLKGQDDLLDITPRLTEKLPGLRIVFVGDGWHGPALRKRVSAEGLADRVIFAGLVEPARVARLLGAMDVCVLPSYQEGQPRALVQALLCRCAIIGYDAGGIGQICIDGQTGRLVHQGDRAALAGAIVWMLEHPDQRRALADAGRAMAAQRFDLRIMTGRLDEIYRRLLAANTGRDVP